MTANVDDGLLNVLGEELLKQQRETVAQAAKGPELGEDEVKAATARFLTRLRGPSGWEPRENVDDVVVAE